MLGCLIAGDSIGVGMSAAAPYCASAVESGISSKRWLEKYANRLAPARNVIVSLGTNDAAGTNTYGTLLELRRQITATTVVWVLPSPALRPEASRSVMRVAGLFNDLVLEVPGYYLGADRIHLRSVGYRNLTSWMKP